MGAGLKLHLGLSSVLGHALLQLLQLCMSSLSIVPNVGFCMSGTPALLASSVC